MLRLLRAGGPQCDARADGLRIALLPDESHFQPMIAVVGQIAIGLQVPREPVLRVFAQLLPPPPLREILERSQQQIAPSVVVEIGPIGDCGHVLVRRQGQQAGRLERVVAPLPEKLGSLLKRLKIDESAQSLN